MQQHQVRNLLIMDNCEEFRMQSSLAAEYKSYHSGDSNSITLIYRKAKNAAESKSQNY
jgi:hypothetical protein